jgi:hypothetical protein
MPLQAFLTIMVACCAAAYSAVSNRHIVMGELFGVTAIVVAGCAIAEYALLPVTPQTALPLTLAILATSSLALWTHVLFGEEREQERERHRPNFDIEIHQVVFGGDHQPSHSIRIEIEITIYNSGADSATRGWSPVVEFMDGHHNYFAEPALSAFGGRNVVLNTATIPRNGRQRGWLRFYATCSGLYDPRNPESGLNEIKRIIICVSDYARGTYEHTAWTNPALATPMAMFEPTRKWRVN